MMRVVLVLILALTLGCSRGARDAAAPAASAPPAAATAVAPAPPARVRGVVVLTAEAPRLLPCGDKVHLELVDRTGEDLSTAYGLLASEQTGEMWVEVAGQRDPTRFVATALLRALPIEVQDPCADVLAPGDVRASGNEPFWGARVSALGIEWSEPGQEPLPFPPSPPQVDGPTRRWVAEFAGEAPHRLELTVTAERCKDSMSGAWLPLKANAVLDGRVVSGCAWDG